MTKLFSLLLLPALLLLPLEVYAETGTEVDANNNVVFTFDSGPSIRIAKKANVAAGQACNAAYEGAMRYNSHADVKGIEFCDGTAWRIWGGKYYEVGGKISVDYASCIDAPRNLPRTYYQQFGASGKPKIKAICPKDYVIIASDHTPRTNLDTSKDAFCCKLKFE